MRLLLRASLIFWCLALPAHASEKDPDPVQRHWRQNCKACHGADGKGQTDMGQRLSVPDFTDAKWQAKKSLADFEKRITHGFVERLDGGTREMPGFADTFSAKEIAALARHVKAFAP